MSSRQHTQKNRRDLAVALAGLGFKFDGKTAKGHLRWWHQGRQVQYVSPSALGGRAAKNALAEARRALGLTGASQQGNGRPGPEKPFLWPQVPPTVVLPARRGCAERECDRRAMAGKRLCALHEIQRRAGLVVVWSGKMELTPRISRRAWWPEADAHTVL